MHTMYESEEDTSNNGHGQIELNSKCFNVNLSNDIDIAENA